MAIASFRFAQIVLKLFTLDLPYLLGRNSPVGILITLYLARLVFKINSISTAQPRPQDLSGIVCKIWRRNIRMP